MTKIKVDFNNLARQGRVRTSLRHADGDVVEGQVVEAFDPAEGLRYPATVVEIDQASGRIYLEPHWEPVDLQASWTFQWTSSFGPTTEGPGLPKRVRMTPAPFSTGSLVDH